LQIAKQELYIGLQVALFYYSGLGSIVTNNGFIKEQSNNYTGTLLAERKRQENTNCFGAIDSGK
jgi:hypothetical protein